MVTDDVLVDASVEELPTPDFYAYPWTPLASATLTDAEIVVGWDDGTGLRCHPLWLYENDADNGTIEPTTREGTGDPASLPHDAVQSATVDASGALEVQWGGGRYTSRFHPGWLRHVAEGQHRTHSSLPAAEPWTAATFTEPPTRSYHSAMAEPGVWHDFVTDLVRFGVARLANTPTQSGTIETVTDRLGSVRDNNFGRIWDVVTRSEATSTAYTSLALAPHTDLPSRETPPGWQLLHCLVNDFSPEKGGLAQITDGLALAHRLEREEPEHYEALTTLRWIFNSRGPNIDHRWSAPVIDLGHAGSPMTFRMFSPVRGFPDMEPEDVPRAYAAIRRLWALASDPDCQLTYPWTPGDLVAFDNRRVLHARTAFDASAGQRHLQGAYLDHDDVLSHLRTLNRRSDTRPPEPQRSNP